MYPKIKNNQKSVSEAAQEVLNGSLANGQERKDRLTKAGYDYHKVQEKGMKGFNYRAYLSMFNVLR